MSRRVVEAFTVNDPLGIHARPAAALAIEIAKSGARVTLRNGTKAADAKSLLQMLALGAAAGAIIDAEIEGEDDAIAAAIAALRVHLAAPSSNP